MLMEENRRSLRSKRSRHLNIRNFYVTDAINKGEIEIACYPTETMLEDFFTKPLQGSLFKKFRSVILGHVPITNLCNYNNLTSKERVEVRNNE